MQEQTRNETRCFAQCSRRCRRPIRGLLVPMNGITDPNWPSGHPRQLPSSILPSGSGGELKNLELNRRSKEGKPECGQVSCDGTFANGGDRLILIGQNGSADTKCPFRPPFCSCDPANRRRLREAARRHPMKFRADASNFGSNHHADTTSLDDPRYYFAAVLLAFTPLANAA